MVEQIEQDGIIINQFRGEGWRLIHDGENVLNLFHEETGLTQTRNNLFIGTEEVCQAEIARLGLKQDE